MDGEKPHASLVSYNAQGASMTPDAFSEQCMPAQPLELDLTRTAVIVVDMVNEFFEPGGKMVLEGGTVLYESMEMLGETKKIN